MKESSSNEKMCLNNEAIESFMLGKRHMAAYQLMKAIQKYGKSDALAYNYAVVNLFTGCPERAMAIFTDLVKKYPKNPRLWLRLAESMIASRRGKMCDFEHVGYSTCCCGGANNNISLTIGNFAQKSTSHNSAQNPGQNLPSQNQQQSSQKALAFVNHGTTFCYHQASGVACNGLLTRIYANLMAQYQQHMISQQIQLTLAHANSKIQMQQQQLSSQLTQQQQMHQQLTCQTLAKMRYILIKNGSNIWSTYPINKNSPSKGSNLQNSVHSSQNQNDFKDSKDVKDLPSGFGLDHQQLIDINNKTRSFLTTIKGHLQTALQLINATTPTTTSNSSTAGSSSDAATDSNLANSTDNQTNTGTGSMNFLPSNTSNSPSGSKIELVKLKNSVYLNLAYICLCMGDPSLARSYTSKCLKSQPQGYQKVLCNLYHAEACILLDRIDEAIQNLNIDTLTLPLTSSPTPSLESSFFPPSNNAESNNNNNRKLNVTQVGGDLISSSGDSESPSNPSTPRKSSLTCTSLAGLSNLGLIGDRKYGKRIIDEKLVNGPVYGDDIEHLIENNLPQIVGTFNLSVALAIKGDYDRAHEMLNESIALTRPANVPLQMTICMLYLHLQQGHFDIAKKIIQQNLPQYR